LKILEFIVEFVKFSDQNKCSDPYPLNTSSSVFTSRQNLKETSQTEPLAQLFLHGSGSTGAYQFEKLKAFCGFADYLCFTKTPNLDVFPQKNQAS